MYAARSNIYARVIYTNEIHERVDTNKKASRSALDDSVLQQRQLVRSSLPPSYIYTYIITDQADADIFQLSLSLSLARDCDL